MEPTTANGLSMRWLPVQDASGRTHLEAVWITDSAPVQVEAGATHAA